MTEWAVVGVIVTLAGMIGTFTVPVVKLMNCITKLTATMERTVDDVDNIQGDIKEFKIDNSKSHKRIHARIDDNVEKINRHENQISTLKEKIG